MCMKNVDSVGFFRMNTNWNNIFNSMLIVIYIEWMDPKCCVCAIVWMYADDAEQTLAAVLYQHFERKSRS